MATRNTEILVGVTVLAALAGVIWSVTALRQVRLAEATQRWLVRFPDGTEGIYFGSRITRAGEAPAA